MSDQDTIVVIGAGAIGLAIAWRLGSEGHRVVVCDPDPGAGASHASAGMIAPVAETHFGEAALQTLNLEGAARWPAFAHALETAGRPSGYRRTGSVAVALDADDRRELDRLYQHQVQLGLPVEQLTAADCREREPVLSARLRGGLWIEGDHQCDNRQLVQTLLANITDLDVQLRRARVAALQTEAARVTGVRLADGTTVSATTVVLAAGAWSATIDGLPPDAVPPVRPVKGQILRLQGSAIEPPVTSCIRAIVRGSHLYVVPRTDGRIVVGATQEDMGFDTTVTAEGMHELLRDLIDLCPGLAELELVETLAGLRPGTPDNGPIVGRAGPDGLIVATGHFRHGILLTPITADAVADLIADREPPAEIVPFGPSRFATPSAA